MRFKTKKQVTDQKGVAQTSAYGSLHLNLDVCLEFVLSSLIDMQ